MGQRSSNRSYGGAAGFPRSRRINRLIQEVLAEELERLADADERLRLLTITEVDTTQDLRHATVFFSSLNEEAREALEERRVALQAAVGRQATMKRTPKLSFEIDPAVLHGEAIDQVLRRLADDDD